jgi:very-short-patch-repair endonuclease/predicted nucleic acid-binding Zn ribbon protein
MKGNCSLVICQICNQEMSFGRIKRHISIKHKEITIDQYLKQYWSTLPLHKPCEVCNENIVYKYKTCSKECHSLLASNTLKGIPKPEGFMSNEHKDKISKSTVGRIVSKETGDKISKSSKGVSRNKGKQPMLGKKQSDETKQIQSQKRKEYYAQGNEPWTKTNKHSAETIEKIFAKKPMNKLEKFVSSLLEEYNIKYHYQFFLKTKDGVCKSYDFKIKDTNILLEIDGDYWHGGPGVEKHFYRLEETKQNDLFKDQLAKDNGYSLIRIWESNIYNKPDSLIQRIQELRQ